MQIILRGWKKEDAAELAEQANNPKVSRYLRDGFPYPYSLEDAEGFIAFAVDQENKDWFVAVEVDGKIAGGASLFFKDNVNRKNAEIGYWLGEVYWGMGIATKVIELLCEKAFSDFGMVRVYAEVFGGNDGSSGALLKNGFELEGRLRKSIYKDGAFNDTLIYGKII